MITDKRPMTQSYTIPKHWKRWAFSRGFAVEKIVILCDEFKEFYAKTDLQLTELAWERRFKKWADSQRKPLYRHEPQAIAQAPEEKTISPFIGLQYLAQMKMMLSNASNKLNHK
jgi:hypothetical protein